jgi:hypothetical protein
MGKGGFGKPRQAQACLGASLNLYLATVFALYALYAALHCFISAWCLPWSRCSSMSLPTRFSVSRQRPQSA